MNIEDNGGAAFPAQEQIDYPSNSVTEFHLGMTLRDYFAAKAQLICPFNAWEHEKAAEWCYSRADAMLEARKK